MAKKKKQVQGHLSSDERIVRDGFDMAIKSIKRATRRSATLDDFDLTGEVLRRRRIATLGYFDEIRKRYEPKYHDRPLLEQWTALCSSIGFTMDQLDYDYYITYAMAIWMLDALKASGELPQVLPVLKKDPRNFEDIRLPDAFDPSHDHAVIREMMNLIRERNPHPKRGAYFFNDATATQILPPPCMFESKIQRSADYEDWSDRQRFEFVISRIHPALKMRAIKRFQDKYWEFVDRYYAKMEELVVKADKLTSLSNNLLAQCEELKAQIDSAETGQMLPSVMQTKLPNALMMPQFSATRSMPSAPRSGGTQNAFQLHAKLRKIIHEGMEYQQRAEDLYQLLENYSFVAYDGLPKSREMLEEKLDEETIRYIEELSVEDPFEICFAYLCMVESGHQMVWTYYPAAAVLSAAVRKLPWVESDYSDDDWLDLSDWEDSQYDPEEDSEEDSDEEDETWDELNIPYDLTPERAKLYEMAYTDSLFYDLDEDEEPGDINFAQFIYEMTGALVPRRVNRSKDLAEYLEEEGIELSTADMLARYLDLMNDMQNRTRDWTGFFQSEQYQTLLRQYGPQTEKKLESSDEELNSLKQELAKANKRVSELQRQLHDAIKEADTLKDQADSASMTSEMEHQELLDLRELVYNLSNDGFDDEEEEETGIEFPYHTKNRVIIVGGHDTWLKAIRPMLPDVTFVPRNQRVNAELIRGADVIWIQSNSLAHKVYYPLIDLARKLNLPVRYFGYASARKCAIQLVEGDMKN